MLLFFVPIGIYSVSVAFFVGQSPANKRTTKNPIEIRHFAFFRIPHVRTLVAALPGSCASCFHLPTIHPAEARVARQRGLKNVLRRRGGTAVGIGWLN